MDKIGIDNKNVLIVGATSGMGETTARYLADQGANLVLVGRNQKKLEQLKEKNKNVLTFSYDLSCLENIEEIFKYCKEMGRKLDGLVYSAGISHNVPIRANDKDIMEDTMRVNYFAFAEIGRYFTLKKYSNDGAGIVALSSLASYTYERGQMNYSASKAALNAAVKTMSKEFIRRKIKVNGILPAYVETPMLQETRELLKERGETFEERQPLGVIEPEQISYLVEFLLSGRAEYMTGELLVVSGGMDY